VTLHLQASVVGFDDRAADRQAQAQALRLRAAKRLEQMSGDGTSTARRPDSDLDVERMIFRWAAGVSAIASRALRIKLITTC
jgi:hypothetical protein